MKLKISFRVRYLLSFILILLIPMSCLMGYTFHNIRESLEQDMAGLNYSNLVQVTSGVDGQIQKLGNLALLASRYQALKPYAWELSNYNYYLAVNTLKDIASTNDLVASLTIYSTAGDLVVSNHGTTPKSYWGDSVFQIALDSGLEIHSVISGVAEPVQATGEVRIPEVGTEHCLLYFQPVEKDGDTPVSVLIAAVSERNILSRFEQYYLGEEDRLLVFDGDGRLVASHLSGQDPDGLWEALLQQMELPVNGSENFSFQGERYSISRVVSFETGWSYISITPYNLMTQHLNDRIQRFGLLMLLLLVLSGAGIYFALRINYRPWLQLKREMEPIVATPQMNELETIRTAVGFLKSNIVQMASHIHRTQPTVRNYLLWQLLWGGITDEGIFRQVSGQTGLNFRYTSYAVGLLNASGEEAQPFLEALSQGGMAMDLYPVDPEYCTPQFLLINLEEEQFQTCQNQIRMLLEEFNSRAGTRIHLALGRPYPFSMINRSYFEARTAENYRKYNESGWIDSFEGVLQEDANVSSVFSAVLVKDLELAILHGDTDYISKFPALFVHEISECGLPHYYGSYLICDITRVVCRSLPDGEDKRELMEEIWQRIYSNGQGASTREVSRIISYICSAAVHCIEHTPLDERSQIHEILDYINQNFTDANFSIQLMAEHFNMSPSWLSHYFKAKVHSTVTEYLQSKRMKYAMERLVEEGCSVSRLAEQLGYSNQSSFIRSFKKTVGMTPKQYQSFYKKEQKQDQRGEDSWDLPPK